MSAAYSHIAPHVRGLDLAIHGLDLGFGDDGIVYITAQYVDVDVVVLRAQANAYIFGMKRDIGNPSSALTTSLCPTLIF